MHIVIDREFGEKLTAVPPGVPVWVVDTPVNRAAAQRRGREFPQDSHLTGFTIFNDSDDASPEELLLNQLATIDLHHGVFSHSPPWTILEVFGSPLTEAIKAAMSEYGVDQFEAAPGGFRARRPKPAR